MLPRAPQPKNPAEEEKAGDDDETRREIKTVGDRTDGGRRDGVAEDVNDENIQAEAGGADRGDDPRGRDDLTALGEFSEALKEFAEAERLDASYPWPHVETAKVFLKQGRDDAAVDELRALSQFALNQLWPVFVRSPNAGAGG